MSEVIPKNVLNKVEENGIPLCKNWNIYTGSIVIGKPSPFVIDDSKCSELVKDKKSSEIIKRVLLRSQKKWKTEPANLITILSSSKKEWSWSIKDDEAEAEQNFAEIYPAVSEHLSPNRCKLKKKVDRGKFWWELKSSNFCPILHQPKIVYSSTPGVGRFMQAGYDKIGILTEEYLHSILPAELHLLAILNSKLFNWYARVKFNKSEERLKLNLCKKNMKQVPIPEMTTDKKVKLSLLVHRILNASDCSNVPCLEQKIDKLVYKLYKLTCEEGTWIENKIESIEKGNNQ